MRKILVVDDDTSVAGLISDVLEDEGFETAVETNGKILNRRSENIYRA